MKPISFATRQARLLKESGLFGRNMVYVSLERQRRCVKFIISLFSIPLARSAHIVVFNQNTLQDYYPLFKFLGVKHESIDDLDVYKSKLVPKRKSSVLPPGGDRLLRVCTAL